ncbi:MAG: ABC transporter permease, partial [Kiritimatiellae bacterium]|nr:ABC transporter permease [Kiritimatiellia bacterium]
RVLWARPLIRACLVVMLLFALLAGYGEAMFQYYRQTDQTPAYQRVDLQKRYQPPGFVRFFTTWSAGDLFRHPLGTDNLGRDVALRIVQGARIAFQVGVVTSLIAIPLGVLLGCLGGYFGGRTDSVVVWIYSTVASMPGLLFILAIAVVVGKGLMGVYLGIGLTTWVGVCRLIRGEVIKHRDLPYVQAARVMGHGPFYILFRHILPNIAHVIIIVFSLRFSAAVSTEVFISFLGLGAQNEPSWGIMINNARLRLWQGMWWELTFVTLALFLLVLSFNLTGDALRDAFDPRLKK